MPRIGDVVIFVPFLKFLELLIFPVIVPSRFFVHCDIIGIPSFTETAFFLGADFFGATFGADLFGGAVFAFFIGEGLGAIAFVPPNKDRVPRGAGLFFSGAFRGGDGVAFGLGDAAPPNSEKVARFFGTGSGAETGKGVEAGAFFGAGDLVPPKREKVPRGTAVGAGAEAGA